ncbi:Start1 [Carabus blaptoides fortunei]
MATPDYRTAAENLLASTSGYLTQSLASTMDQSSNTEALHSHSINTTSSLRPEIVISEDLIAGQRLNGTMSNVRRFFCLFVTFDLCFTCLMWLICVMLNGENIVDALKAQIVHYNIHSSLFDIVMASICRFTVLLLFYALLYFNHKIIIALSTAGTCAFLICKVFVFNWTDSPQPVFQVLLVLVSFILSWSEAWFLDFRVIPQEMNASRYLVTTESERTPLIRSYVQGLPSTYTESVGNFYSPLQSPEGSLYSPDFRRESRFPVTKQQEDDYKKRGVKIMEDAWRTLNHPDWKMEKQSAEGDTVETMVVPKVGKLFRLTGVVNVPPRYLLDELFYRVEELPKWNSAVRESRKLHVIDEYTDITYQVSPEGSGGIISCRDFINLRHWGIVDCCYVSASVSIEHPDAPKNNKYIRGENGIGCWVMRPINDEPYKCVFQWLLNTNLKGWIPQKLLETALTSVMFDYLNDLRQYAAYLKQSGKIH